MVVLTSETAPSGDLLTAIQSAGGSVMRRHDDIGVVTVAGLSDAAAAALAARGDIEGIDRDYLVQRVPSLSELRVETDQSRAGFFPFQWNMRQVEADDAWLTTARVSLTKKRSSTSGPTNGTDSSGGLR